MSCDTNNGQVISLGSSQHNQDPGLILADEQLANVMHLNNDEENFGGQFDEIDSLINSQLNQLPHFFFDTWVHTLDPIVSLCVPIPNVRED